MSKLRIIFIASLTVLIAILAITLFRPIIQDEAYSELTRESIIKKKDEWIIQFDIFNREGKDIDYTIIWYTGDQIYRSSTMTVGNGRIGIYIHHFYPHTVEEGQLKLEIYKEGDSTPFEQSVYHVTFN
ncbi:hypothetical protein ACFLV3_01230 [Chloroflexota bacterium]